MIKLPNLDEYKLVVFEIIPIERIGRDKLVNPLNELSFHLSKIGYAEEFQSPNMKIFHIKDYSKFADAVKLCIKDEEYNWLFIEYFEKLILSFVDDNLLFALTSSKSPDIFGPYNRDAKYIASLMGEPIYSPSIGRILVAYSQEIGGNTDLAKKLRLDYDKYILSKEPALSGDILLLEPPIIFDLTIICKDKGITLRPLNILSSDLLSSDIIELLKDETLLNRVEIGKAFPLQIFSLSDLTNFSVFNHFSVRGLRGKLAELFTALLQSAIHLNWQLASDYVSTLNKDDALQFALLQKNRLRQVEEKYSALTHSLQLLQRRYPHRIELFEWEVNNIYANMIHYSPIYLNWKTHLEAFIEGQVNEKPNFINNLSAIDWKKLEQNNIANLKEAQKIIKLMEIDPGSTLTRIRIIIEKIINYVYSKKMKTLVNKNKKLAEKLYELNDLNVFPQIIYIYLNTLRLVGNIAAHQGEDSKREVESVLPIFILIVEWFIDKGIKF
jgi:hypothetical protein